MLKRTIILILLIVPMIAALFIRNGCCENRLSAVGTKLKSKISKKNYYIGEKIVYDVNLGSVHIGKARFNNLSLIELDSKKANLITFETKVTNFSDLEKIYCDPDTLLPFRVERDIRKLHSHESIIETYNQKKFTLAIKKTRGRKVEEFSLKSDGPIQNAVLLPFFVRGASD